MSQQQMEDFFLQAIDEYGRGFADLSIDRRDDSWRRSSEYLITFRRRAGVPRSSNLDLLRIIFDMVKRGGAYVQSYQDYSSTIEFRLHIQDVDRLEYEFRQTAQSQYTQYAFPPSYAAASSQPQIIPPLSKLPELNPSKPKKITTEKKVRTAALVGYRDFTFVKKGNQSRPLLLSRNGVPWPRYAPLVASCNGDPFKEHDAPSVGCQCGIYAFNRPDHPELKTSSFMWGEIALWGKVLICPHGYRAEYAYPLNIFIKDVGTKTVRAFGEAIENQYGVPVHLVKERSGKKASEVMAEMIDKLLKESLSAD